MFPWKPIPVLPSVKSQPCCYNSNVSTLIYLQHYLLFPKTQCAFILELWKEFISLDFAWLGGMMEKKWLRQLGAAILIPFAEYASTFPSWPQKEILPPPYLPPIQGRCRRRLKRVTFSFLVLLRPDMMNKQILPWVTTKGWNMILYVRHTYLWIGCTIVQ